MASKVLKLNISERLAALAILNEFKGKLEEVAVVLEDIKQLPISEEEWEKAEKKENKLGDNVNWTWDNDKGGDKAITLQETTVDIIRRDIKARDEKGGFSLADRSIVTLKDKLI